MSYRPDSSFRDHDLEKRHAVLGLYQQRLDKDGNFTDRPIVNGR